jgi:putative N6-adenine-specific DNA methylase
MPERPRGRPQSISGSATQQFFSPCPRGLEHMLCAELEALGAADPRPLDGGVAFAGDFHLCYAVNLHSRIASRVLWRLALAPYRDENDVYQAVSALPWRDYFAPERTIRVNVSATACPLKSLDFVTLRIKDAVCDRFRAQTGRRPSVDTAGPDVRIHAYLDASTLSLYLDTSGEPLFKRGLRVAAGEAPLRENLAAGILQLAGWSPGTPLLDPMCGGGTFLVEAAEAALQRAPGSRRSFAFEKLTNFEAARWAELRAQAQAAERAPQPLPIFGSDLYGSALKLAWENLSHAGLEGVVQLKQANALEISAPAAAGVLVANPPYGVRLGEQQALAELYPRLGDVLKQRFAGWRACIFTADLRLPKLIGLKPARRIPLYNGALECRLYVFELIAGSMRGRKDAQAALGDEGGAQGTARAPPCA